MKTDLILKCNGCEDVFNTKFELLEHKNVHSGENPFMCASCKRHFILVKDYVDHIKSQLALHSENFNNIDSQEKHIGFEKDAKFCTNCLKTFKNLEDFKSHSCYKKTTLFDTETLKKCNCCSCALSQKEVMFEKISEAFVCNYCEKKFSTNLNLAKHICCISSCEKTFKCSCSQVFTKASAFKSHLGKKPYSCCSCSMQFNTITNLIRHIRTHTKQKPYICKDCGRGFSQSANLRNHSSIHLGIRAIKCDKCNFSCKTLSGLIKHKKKHDGLNHQNYLDGRKKSTGKCVCPVCNKQFKYKRNMGMHMKIHNNKISLCTECGKVFNSKSKLTSHYKACHRNPSCCKVCGKVFASAVLLNAHEKIHVSDKSFSCEFCQKMFSVKNYLIQHMKTHSNKKQFACSKCGKLFKVAISLKYHSNICTQLKVIT